MERRSRISLDDPTFQGRLRADSQGAVLYARPHAFKSRNQMDGFKPFIEPKPVSRASPIPHVQRVKPSVEAVTVKMVPTPKTRPDLPKQARSNVLKRQMVKSSSKKFRPKKHHRSLIPTLLSAMAVVLFSVGLLTVFNTLRTGRNVNAQGKQLAKQTDDGSSAYGMPSEEDPPANIGTYNVAIDLPKLLTIEKIGVNARIRRADVGANNVLKAPSNIFDVGWYDGSAKPGENGTIVLEGHVSGPTKHGVFYSIGSLKPGDKAKLERGDGKIFTYTVIGTQIYDNDKVDMAKVMTTSVPGKPALNFITCTGRFNVRTNNFEQRIVVFAVLDQ